ncbi:MAG: endonuclease Q family protein [Candidatus Marsarchaeota archaeon]|nr:endonuclease Q family protein [Candidatus Marsarchaeota archaeon]
MDIGNMALSAKRKGLQLVGTGDAVHPKYFEEIKKEAEETEGGFLERDGILFVPTVEVNNTFEQPAGKKRRVHTLVVLPDMETARRFSELIAPVSKLGVDGRPWVRMSLEKMTQAALELHPKILIIPAHVWTPWYGVFGAKGGFGSLKEAFGGQAKNVHAIETGLSSDPPMNWRCSWLDGVRILSFSDAHSPDNLAREASELEMEKMDYESLWKAVAAPDSKNHLVRTIEFFPQEGKYYSDGHRACGLRLTAEETRKLGGRCPKCGKKITKGVLGRIDSLADRGEGEKPPMAAPFTHLVPLRTLVGMALERGAKTQGVEGAYDLLVEEFGSEMGALEAEPAEIERKLAKKLGPELSKKIAHAISLMQKEKLELRPGFDGQYGEVRLPQA